MLKQLLSGLVLLSVYSCPALKLEGPADHDSGDAVAQHLCCIRNRLNLYVSLEIVTFDTTTLIIEDGEEACDVKCDKLKIYGEVEMFISSASEVQQQDEGEGEDDEDY